MNPPTILVVGRNPLLPQVVRHLLAYPPPTLLTAGNLDEAIAYTDQRPDVAVVEVPGGKQAERTGLLDPRAERDNSDAANVLFGLRAHFGPVPFVLLVGNPEALPAFPPEWQPPPRVLTAAPDLDSLKQALHELLGRQEPTQPVRPRRLLRTASFIAGLIVVSLGLLLVLPMLPKLLAGTGSALANLPLPNLLELVVARPEAASAPPATTIHEIEGKPNVFRLEEDAAEAMRIPSPFRVPQDPKRRQLTLSGSLAFDPDKLGRVQSRFPGEVISIEKATPAPGVKGQSTEAPLSYGDGVRKGQVMAVVWSSSLGEKKSELVDWLVKLSLDEENLKRLEELWLSGAGTEASYRAAKNAVSADLNGIARARRTLETWKVDKDEVKAIEKEADRIIAAKSLRALNQLHSVIGKWARVEVTAPFDGVIVEKNLAIGNMVDPTQDLFRVADLHQLAVFANAYEEDQRLLQDMQAKTQARHIPWRVNLTSDPEKRALDSDGIERIGYIVDPQQRTNLAIGKVKNTDERLRVGQSVTALVNIPAPKGVVAIPASSLVEDGSDSVVFVQPDPNKLTYEMRRVMVVQRFNIHPLPDSKPTGAKTEPEQWAYVSSVLDDKQKAAGLRALTPGEYVLASAVVELKAALEEVQARARAKR